MNAEFSIDVEPQRDLVRIRMAGFFEAQDVSRFVAERDTQQQKLKCGRNQHLTLSDLRDMKIQPQDSVTAFRAVLANPAAQSRRLAFVIQPSLTRAQLERACEGRAVRFFDDMLAAEDWLFSNRD